MATMPGQTFGISVFNPYLRDSFSLSHSELGGAYMLGTLLASLPMIYVGALMDRHGPRKTLFAVTIFFGLTCIGMSQTRGLVSIFFCFLFLRMFGQGAMCMLASNALAMWFNRRLGLAAGIVSLGEAISLGIFPTLNLILIQSLGWRSAYAALGFCVWAVTLPLLTLAFRNRPADMGQVIDGGSVTRKESPAEKTNQVKFRDYTMREAMSTRPYWIMTAATALPSMIITGIHFHAVQIYVDFGLRPTDAAAMFTTVAASFSIVMVIAGILADRVPLNVLLSIAMACLSGGIVLLTQVEDTITSNLFSIVTGGSHGGFYAVMATIWVRYYGRQHLGKIRGSMTTVGVAASSAGPFVMGIAHDLFGSYNEVLWLFVALTAPMVLIAIAATAPRKIPVVGADNYSVNTL